MSEDALTIVKLFRIKELQEVLSILGLAKTGRKDDLKARLERHLMDIRADPGRYAPAAREVTRVYRRMKGLPLEDLGPTNRGPAFQQRAPGDGCSPSSSGQKGNSRGYPSVASNPRFGNGLPNGQAQRANARPSLHNVLDAPLNPRGYATAGPGRVQPGQPPPPASSAEANTEIRCVCGHNKDAGDMIQCEGEKCGVWQHSRCVGVDPLAVPEHFFCELCRIARADPFWVRVFANFFSPARLNPQQQGIVLSPNGSPPTLIKADREFNVAYPHLQLCGRDDHQLQLACVLFGDKVPFRLHWPMHTIMSINARGYRPYSRNSSNKLGNNAVDEAANLSPYVKQGSNLVSLGGTDGRPFCMVLQLVKKRPVDEVKAMMAPPETSEQALQRVRSQTGGQQNDSDDEGLEISATILSLRDPNTSTRVVTPARFLGVGGIVAFDLDTYLEVVKKSRKWLCPFSTKPFSIRELQLDGFLGPVLAALKGYPDVMEVEVSPDATWRPSGSTCRWLAITEDPAAVVAALAAGGVAVKKDPDPLASLPVNRDDESTSEDVSEREEMRRAAKAYASKARIAPPPKPEVIVLSDSDSGETSRPSSRPSIVIAPNRPIAMRAVPLSPRSSGHHPHRRVENGGRSGAEQPRYHPYARPAQPTQSSLPHRMVPLPAMGMPWDVSNSAAPNGGRMQNQQNNASLPPVFDYPAASTHQPSLGLPTVQSVPLPMSNYGQPPAGPLPPPPPLPGPPRPPLPYQTPAYNPFNTNPYGPSNLQPGHIGPPMPHSGMSDVPDSLPDFGPPQGGGPGPRPPGQAQGAGPSNGAAAYTHTQGSGFMPPPNGFGNGLSGGGGFGPPPGGNGLPGGGGGFGPPPGANGLSGGGGFGPPPGGGGFSGPPSLPPPPPLPGMGSGVGGQRGDFGGAGQPHADGHQPPGSGFAPPPPPPAGASQNNGYLPMPGGGFANNPPSGGYGNENQGAGGNGFSRQGSAGMIGGRPGPFIGNGYAEQLPLPGGDYMGGNSGADAMQTGGAAGGPGGSWPPVPGNVGDQGGQSYAAGDLANPMPGSGMPVLPLPPGDNQSGSRDFGPDEFIQDSFLDRLFEDGIPGDDNLPPPDPNRPPGPLDPTPFRLVGARSHQGGWGTGPPVGNGPGEMITVISDSD